MSLSFVKWLLVCHLVLLPLVLFPSVAGAQIDGRNFVSLSMEIDPHDPYRSRPSTITLSASGAPNRRVYTLRLLKQEGRLIKPIYVLRKGGIRLTKEEVKNLFEEIHKVRWANLPESFNGGLVDSEWVSLAITVKEKGRTRKYLAQTQQGYWGREEKKTYDSKGSHSQVVNDPQGTRLLAVISYLRQRAYTIPTTKTIVRDVTTRF